jgi:putative inorganic carbon (hco3(-)) transporter
MLLVGVAFAALAYTEITYRFGPKFAVGLAGAAAALLIALTRPMLSLYLAIGLIPFELVSIPLGSFGLSPAELMLALAAIGWLAQCLAAGRSPVVRSPLGVPLAAFIVAVIPGLAIAPHPLLVVKTLVFLVFFFLVYQMVVADGRRETVRRVLLLLALAGAAVGVIAVVKSGGQAPQLEDFGEAAKGRATGSFGHPNTFATFEGVAMPAALALALGAVDNRLRPVMSVAFVVIVAGLALSLSRGGLLAAGGALAVMLLWAPFRRAALAAAVVVTIVVASGAGNLGQVEQVDTVTKRLSSVSYSAQGVDPRFLVWRAAPQMIRDHVVLGVGEGQFPDYAPAYGLVNLNVTGTFEHAHNILLTFWAELGLIGLAAFCWLGGKLVLVLRRGWGRVERRDRGLVLAVLAGFVAFFLQGMVDYTLRSNVIVASLFLLAACAVVLAEGPEQKQPQARASAR